MTSGGSAAGATTINSVTLKDADGKGEMPYIPYSTEEQGWPMSLEYTFSTDNMQDVSGKTIVLTLPDYFTANTVTAPQDFFVGGEKKGTYTIDGEAGTVTITLNETATNLHNGQFRINVITNGHTLKDHVGSTVNVGGKDIPVQLQEIDFMPIQKTGNTKSGGEEADPNLADNQVKWQVLINPTAAPVAGDMTITDTVLQMKGGATIVMDNLMQAPSPEQLVVVDVATSAPAPFTATVNPEKTGFNLTIPQDQISG